MQRSIALVINPIFFCSQPGVEIGRRVNELYWLLERANALARRNEIGGGLHSALTDLRARRALGRADSESEDGWDEPGPSETGARRVDARLANAEVLISPEQRNQPIPPGPVVGVRQLNLINRLKIAILIGLIIVLSCWFL